MVSAFAKISSLQELAERHNFTMVFQPSGVPLVQMEPTVEESFLIDKRRQFCKFYKLRAALLDAIMNPTSRRKPSFPFIWSSMWQLVNLHEFKKVLGESHGICFVVILTNNLCI